LLYFTIEEEFNVDSKAECYQLNLEIVIAIKHGTEFLHGYRDKVAMVSVV